MLQFVLSILLFFMFFPALMAVTFANRSVFFFFWNMFWFYVMAIVAQTVFQSPQAAWVGGAFAILYIFRAITRPRKVIHLHKFDFKNFSSFAKNFDNQKTRTTENVANNSTLGDQNVIDVKYTKD